MDKPVINRSFQDKCVYCVSGGLYRSGVRLNERRYYMCWSKSVMALDYLKEETCCNSVTDQV